MPFKSIRFKLAITYATILLFSFIVFGVISYLSISTIMLNNLDSSLKIEVDWIKKNITPVDKRKRARNNNMPFVFNQPKPQPKNVKKPNIQIIDSTQIVAKDTV